MGANGMNFIMCLGSRGFCFFWQLFDSRSNASVCFSEILQDEVSGKFGGSTVHLPILMLVNYSKKKRKNEVAL